MKTTRVTVRWKRGLHMLTAAQLVRLAQRFHSSIRLRLGTRIADARSILNLMLLSATLGTSLEIEAAGDDEQEATQAVEDFFANQNSGGDRFKDEPPEPHGSGPGGFLHTRIALHSSD